MRLISTSLAAATPERNHAERLSRRVAILCIGVFSLAAWAVIITLPDYALSSAIKAWYKTGTYGCFCGFERWRATRCNFKRGSARPSLLFFTEQRISAGRR